MQGEACRPVLLRRTEGPGTPQDGKVRLLRLHRDEGVSELRHRNAD